MPELFNGNLQRKTNRNTLLQATAEICLQKSPFENLHLDTCSRCDILVREKLRKFMSIPNDNS